MDFYYHPGSAPCRAVIMLARTLGIDLNKILVNTMEREQYKPEFMKINPQHCVPTLVDDGFTLWESRAILIYLVEKYGKDDSLYPSDPQQRAVINQRLYFDMGTLFQSFFEAMYPQMLNKPVEPAALKKVETALQWLDSFLEGQQYVAGDSMSVADISILATISTFEVLDYDFSPFPNLSQWYENAKEHTPGWEENWEGIVLIKKFVEANKAK
ncbi:uncharacterized protein Dwil_GK11878 [Drosophila willistoni]|uniref:Glutathione transferase n=1 Tax=Drosophila willistoni TaxID=7260 RepID=B4NBD7_DROWI|nr:glutathione S-transferase D2 [Drosophila willistoni]EDW81101.1 uncharacterized protein Dwil_GK11878 [Drosophila willistoni]